MQSEFQIFYITLQSQKKVVVEDIKINQPLEVYRVICHFYWLCDRIFQDDFSTDLNKMVSGWKKGLKKYKQKNGFRIEEVKTPMSLQIYSLLCDYIIQQPDNDSILCHAFLMLEWNLMTRSDNVTSCHLNHIEWRNGSLVIFLRTKKVIRRV